VGFGIEPASLRAAHFIKQHEHNRLIRPRYTGPDVRHALPLGQRS
jgi:citrate synthase